MTKSTMGRRIAVYGPSGSGKTTFSRQVGDLLSLPVIELDSIQHMPNWEERPTDDFRAVLTARLDERAHGWICDGNYGSKARDLVLARADTVVWLRLPFRVVYPRLVWRTLRRMWTREELWNGNRESFRMSFFSRDSILLWGISHWREHHRRVEEDLKNVPHIAKVMVLRSPREVDEFLAQVEHSAATAPS